MSEKLSKAQGRQRSLGTVVDVTKKLLAAAVRPGETVIDATAGNGHDTLFLAGLVGEAGRVIALDIQEQALASTASRLEKAGFRERCTLVLRGHEHIAEVMQASVSTQTSEPMPEVAAIMFNLGYLPSGDHSRVTRSDTTRRAILDGLQLLRIGGLMSIVVYSGHQGGAEEATMVEEVLGSLDQTIFAVLKLDFINRKNNSPFLFLIEREQL